jgi:galactose oxidase-like protein/Kelch motif protein
MLRSPLFMIALIVAVCMVTIALSTPAPTSRADAGLLVSAADMLAPRSGHTATLLTDGRVLIVGGMRRNQDFYRSTELYDPKNGKFQAAGDMLTARVGHAAVLLPSGKVLIAGGWVGHGTTDEAELYDPAAGKFTAIARMTTKRGRPEATLLRDGNVLVTGGGSDSDGPGSTIVSAEIFDITAMKFRPTGSMHHARIAHTATLLLDGRVLIAGGRGSEVNASAEIYDSRTGTFRETGSMMNARYKHTAGLLPDGRVLLAGGSDERDWHGMLSSAEIYDPQRGTFTSTASLHSARFKLPGAAVQLRSGQLLIAGGDQRAEVYDGASGKFAVVAGDIGDARHYMTETLLGDGRVLLTGGYANNPEATARTWIYRP